MSIPSGDQFVYKNLNIHILNIQNPVNKIMVPSMCSHLCFLPKQSTQFVHGKCCHVVVLFHALVSG